MVSVLEQCKLVCKPTPYSRKGVVCMVRIRNTFYNKDLFDYSPQLLQGVTSGESMGVMLPTPTASVLSRFLDFLLNFMMTLSILVTLLYFLPGVLDRVNVKKLSLGGEASVAQETVAASSVSTNDVLVSPNTQWQQPMPEDRSHRVAPVYDLSLPEGRWVISEEVGIKAPIYTNANVEDTKEIDAILDRGIYLYPEYDNIGWSGREVILAGHHYNMNVSETKSAQSFQNLEKLKVGDRVQIVDDYKIWTYEIYKVEQSTEISEQNPDLMMYTCIYWWDAKLRLFVYGKIVEEQPQEIKE